VVALPFFRSRRSADAPPDAAEAPSRLALADGLRSVIDPELGLDVVALGLIYDLQVEDGEATVRLTMTTPACPMSSYIKRQVGGVLQKTPGLRRGVVELVWDPPWSPHMIEPEARARLFGGRRIPTY
jgi:metal-sulfur cluster biosynthetic enzyme